MNVRDDFKALKRVIGTLSGEAIESEIQLALENLTGVVGHNKLVLISLVLQAIHQYRLSLVDKQPDTVFTAKGHTRAD